MSFSQQLLQFRPDLRGRDERLADQKRPDPRLQKRLDLLPRPDPAFADRDPVFRDEGCERHGGPDVRHKGLQVPVVDPDDLRSGGQGLLQFLPVVDLDQGGEPQRVGQIPVFPELPLRKDGRDEQDGVRADRPRLADLVRIDDELLPEDRQA